MSKLEHKTKIVLEATAALLVAGGVWLLQWVAEKYFHLTNGKEGDNGKQPE